MVAGGLGVFEQHVLQAERAWSLDICKANVKGSEAENQAKPRHAGAGRAVLRENTQDRTRYSVFG